MKNCIKKLQSVVFVGLIMISNFTMVEEVKADEKDSPNLVFPVISDVHIGAGNSELKFREALKDFKSVYPNYNAIVMVGDSTDKGKERQYGTLMQILNEEKPKNAENIITMGNHEYYEGNLDNAGYEKRFVNKTLMPAVYYDKWIKGYHFIALAPEHNEWAMLSETQLKWFSEKLKENEDESKPIFVFLHQPFSNTVFGSESWGAIGNHERLYEILKEHPQVIFFSGHSHYSLEDKKTMYQKDFIMFNTASINYIMTEGDGYGLPELSQGLLVEVYDGEVVVKSREISQHRWIGRTYNIKYPVISFVPIVG